ncbi:3-hydroxybutyrate dehydrogenase [Bradyrhizobium sp. USDA 4369]
MRTVLVTGALGGIGNAIIARLAELGNTVIATDRVPAEQAESVIATSFQPETIKEYIPCDLRNRKDVIDLMAIILGRYSSVDILVNNAGLIHRAHILDHHDDDWDEQMMVNATAPYLLTKGVVGGMLKNDWGRIVNISSVVGLVGSKNRSGYVTSKHALVGFTKAVALDVAETGVTVNAICPGWVDTNMNIKGEFADKAKSTGGSLGDAKRALVEEKQPNGRMIPLEEIAEMAAFLASERASSITGSMFSIDGGWAAV